MLIKKRFACLLLPDRVQSQAVAWQHSVSRGHCERLAALAEGHAIGHLPPELDPTANALVWLNHGSLRTPVDHFAPKCCSRIQKHQKMPVRGKREKKGKGSVKIHEPLKTVKESHKSQISAQNALNMQGWHDFIISAFSWQKR